MVTLVGDDLKQYFRQTLDFIFIDSVNVEPGESAEGYSLLKSDAWYFDMHFPGNPVLPGVFQMEMIQQTGGLIINTLNDKQKLKLYMYSADDIKFHKAARPGDRLHTLVILQSYRRGIGKFAGSLFINDELSCKMNFVLIAPDEMEIHK